MDEDHHAGLLWGFYILAWKLNTRLMGYRCDDGLQAGAEDNAGETTGQERRRGRRDMLVNSGHTIKQVQEFLGHEKASTTLDIYSHVSLEGKKNTAVAMDELLTGKSA